MSSYKFLTEALLALAPNHGFQIIGEHELENVEWIDFPDPMLKDADIITKCEALQAEYDAQEYARKRAEEYPSTGDQMDMIYKDNKNSTTTHATAVEAVKTKWPKDNSGPK